MGHADSGGSEAKRDQYSHSFPVEGIKTNFVALQGLKATAQQYNFSNFIHAAARDNVTR